ncbi:GNAT family N-acetyltransferase [Aeromonas hydrophila]|uniref:GNAT family N-acetyltransferase n=1 Tax=Aeromonas hydrophila TaxID=644 RepID=UPI0004D3C9ED|nr:GNAT family N-acetyltransferase [Aeromonas hydrophila]EJN6957919.1 GNAT family N-acetyltransferase [Aeromonas hydrophila]KER62754.1 histone acetyltransferase [Aeromonas hydrophila]MCX4040060.1 GNAT family N-acetyltransferase [Aeromonas hydrophila]OCA60152.1 histone acetyltransferase [Aeromonas hydrophila]TNI61599.1 N-acetyltransferase [Aeromonas hydrophila]
MEIELAGIATSEFEQRFAAVKEGIFPYVEAVFGWDDEMQRERLTSEYEPHWLSWILAEGEQVGLLCCKPYDDALHVHLLIIFPRYQGRQLGSTVMARLHREAASEGRHRVTLSSFSANQRAIEFYRRLGYQVVAEEPAFVSLSRPVTREEYVGTNG